MILRKQPSHFNYYLIVILSILTLLSACSKDAIQEKPPFIVGKWTPTNFVYKELINGAWEETIDDEDDLVSIELYENGKGILVATDLEGTETLQFTYDSKSVTFGGSDHMGPPGGIYSIKSITSNQLILFYTASDLTLEITFKK